MFIFPVGNLVKRVTGSPLLLDLYQGAAIACAIKRIRSDYRGPCIRLRRQSGAADIFLDFNSDGTLRKISATNAVNAGDTLYVVEWYNQSTRGGFASMQQPITANQPTFTPSNPAFDNNATINFSASTGLENLNAIDVSAYTGVSFISRVAPSDTSTPGTLAFLCTPSYDSTGKAALKYLDAATYIDASTGAFSVSGKRLDSDTIAGTKGGSTPTAGSQITVSSSINYTDATAELSVNGTSVRQVSGFGTTGTSGTSAPFGFRIGCGRSTLVGNFVGSMNGLIFYPFAISPTLRTAIEAGL